MKWNLHHVGGRKAFTLIEIMISTTILVVLMAMVFTALGQVSDVWRKSTARIEVFQGARLAFDLVTRSVSQATLNTSLDYLNTANKFLSDLSTPLERRTFFPDRYARRSTLNFVCGMAGMNGYPGVLGTGTATFFQAPLAYTDDAPSYGQMDAALNVCGFYVDFGPDSDRPLHITSAQRYRYRLMQILVPIEENEIYIQQGSGNTNWFANFKDDYARQIADNIILLLIQPQDPEDPTLFSTSYRYDSWENAAADPQPVTANQLPPVMRVTLVAIDETSAKKIENNSAQPGAIISALSGKFNNPAAQETDLQNLTNELNNQGIQSRVFSTLVPVRESKWSKN
jgi:uncharacterized protein (TIGR02599 family)